MEIWMGREDSDLFKSSPNEAITQRTANSLPEHGEENANQSPETATQNRGMKLRRMLEGLSLTYYKKLFVASFYEYWNSTQK